MKVIIVEEKAEVYTPYNPKFVNIIKRAIGGAKWESTKKCWVVPAESVSAVRSIMRDVYGIDDTESTEDIVDVKITVTENIYNVCDNVTVFGKTLCRAYSRDSGGKAGEGVSYLSGAPESGGSRSHWRSIVPAGAVLVLTDVSKNIIEKGKNNFENGSFDYEIIDNNKINRQKLLDERDKLLARIAEIDKLLAQ